MRGKEIIGGKVGRWGWDKVDFFFLQYWLPSDGSKIRGEKWWGERLEGGVGIGRRQG